MILEVLVRLYIQLKSRFLGQFVDGEPSGGENPPSAGFRGDLFGRVAQLVEHLIENQGVTSSSLVLATIALPTGIPLGPKPCLIRAHQSPALPNEHSTQAYRAPGPFPA